MANPFMYGWGIDVTSSPSFKKAAELQNKRWGAQTFLKYANLAANVYAFEGLGQTPTVSERTFREGLLWYPLVAIFQVGDAWVNLPATPGGRGFNAQGYFGDCFAYGKNGAVYHVNLKLPGEDESDFLSRTPGPETPGEYRGVAIRCNDACSPDIITVLQYSTQIADLFSALANMTPLMHHPVALSATQKQMKTVLTWWRDLDKNVPFTFLSSTPGVGGVPQGVEVTDLLHGGDIVKPAVELLDWYDQRCLMDLGIRNAGTQVDKKGENLTEAEVTSSDDVTDLILQTKINTINKEIEIMGLHDIPALSGLTCKAAAERRKENDISDVPGGESNTMADEPSDDSRPGRD